MRKHLRDVLVALSLANLCFIPTWRFLLEPSSTEYYYSWKAFPRWSELAAISLNVLVLAACFWAVAYITRRFGGPILTTIVRILLIVVFLVVLNDVRVQLEFLQRPKMVELFGMAGFLGLSAMLGLVGMGLLVRLRLVRTTRTIQSVLLVLFPVFIITFSQALLLTMKYKAAVLSAKAPAARYPKQGPARVLWVIFDEFDYRLGFDARPTTLQLPELDRLKAESLFAKSAFPPAKWTKWSLPALIDGKLVSNSKAISPDELLIDVDEKKQIPWSSQPNIFSDARKTGNNVAVVGWYHPYCRLFGDSLSNCYWDPAGTVDTRRLRFGFDVVLQARQSVSSLPIIGSVIFNRSDEAASSPESHLNGYQKLLAEAKEVVADDGLGLILLHLPVPHPPNVYDRKSSQLTTTGDGSYLDSLALVDVTLGELRSTMEKAGQWDNTTVLISSDHWFRKDEFRSGTPNLKLLSAEQQNVLADETVDHRIPFILKMAGHQEGMEFEFAFNTVITHDLILSILDGEIKSPVDASNWITSHSRFGESPVTKGQR